MSKHTPGPWYPFINIEKGCLPGIDHPKGSLILYGEPGESCGIAGANHEERIANARLIAAAPTLLDALESLVMAIELPGEHCEVEQAIREARAALQAAKGGGDNGKG